jgi:tRNA A37 threonylcarbamoyladenosine synthetase subunit TsaC/SUA5/YrdC
MSTTLIPQDEDEPLNDAQAIFDRYSNQLSAVIDGGACPLQPTTVIDLTGATPEIVRRGQGDLSALGLD